MTKTSLLKIIVLFTATVVLSFIVCIDLNQQLLGQFRIRQDIGIPQIDKMMHFSLMAGLAFLTQMAFTGSKDQRREFFTIAFLILLFACTIEEYSQLLIVGRQFSLGDLFSNWAGVFVGGAIGYKLSQRFDPRFAPQFQRIES